MVALGYALLGEEHGAPDLVRHAMQAEVSGFSFAIASDHYHPWTDAQGHSPFVWSTLGAIAQATASLVIGTGVTCPTMRIHPAIVAQAAATMATLAPERFFFGVGSGEYLNEHILGDPWPPAETRLEMLREAIEVIRELWRGEEYSHDGAFFTVHRARLYSVPSAPPALLVAAGGPAAAAVAAEEGDGIIATSPDAELLDAWSARGGDGPRVGMFHTAYAETLEEGRALIARYWSHAALPSHMHVDLATPAQFEGAAKYIRPEDYDERTPQGPDPVPVIETIQRFVEAGFDHVLVHQIGPDQPTFLDWFKREIAPNVEVSPPTLTV